MKRSVVALAFVAGVAVGVTTQTIVWEVEQRQRDEKGVGFLERVVGYHEPPGPQEVAEAVFSLWMAERLAEHLSDPRGYPAAAGKLVKGSGSRVHRGWVHTAVFVVGPGDEGWMRRNAWRLEKSMAIGFLVDAESEDAAGGVLEAAEAMGLWIVPVDGDAVADYLEVENRPVLVLPGWFGDRRGG